MDPYEKQDSINKLFPDSMNHIYLVTSANDHGITQEYYQVENLSPTVFDSLKGFLNYTQQMRGSISYQLRLKVKKTDERAFPSWRLLDVIKITKLNKPPYPLIAE